MIFFLTLFLGLAVDAGSIYVTYGQLKRAVDASAVAAANNFKRNASLDQMQLAAEEILKMHNIDNTTIDVHICDKNGTGFKDPDLETTVPEFYKRCPTTNPAGTGDAPRKLVWIEAKEDAPVYFMGLLGFKSFPLHTSAIAEAAQVDVMLVFDVSESMGSGDSTPGYTGNQDNYNPNDPDPTKGCNPSNCHPLEEAKAAAKTLVSYLYEGYDQVGIVTFDSQAAVHRLNASSKGLTLLTRDNRDDILNLIDGIRLHDDPPAVRLPGVWTDPSGAVRYNPVNPEDRDGNGEDWDAPDMYGAGTTACLQETPEQRAAWEHTLWDNSVNPYGWSGTGRIGTLADQDLHPGVPCDRDDIPDTYDWNGNGIYNDEVGDPLTIDDSQDPPVVTSTVPAGGTDYDLAQAWLNNPLNDPDESDSIPPSLSPISTCTGCGLRMASNQFKVDGRPNAVWVMVVLSDGVVNLSDTPKTAGWAASAPESNYHNGFCQGGIKPDPDDSSIPDNGYWQTYCRDKENTPRTCIDTDPATCPPGSQYELDHPGQYSVLDYAMDMVDEASLTISEHNPDETLGNNIAIYSIFLDSSSAAAKAEYLMRYMADVGDDGNRDTAPCLNPNGLGLEAPALHSCGQYYYAPGTDQLVPIFENIASRIYTRITD